jgi:hypothetical protein
MKMIDGIEWFSCDYRMPPEDTLVLVTGPSGYRTHDKFLALAWHSSEYRPPINGETRWQSVTNDSLLDQGWRPTHWARAIKLP